MGLLSSRQVLVGLALIIVGTLGLLPSVFPTGSQTMTYVLLPAGAALVVGTWLVGTSEAGRPV